MSVSIVKNDVLIYRGIEREQGKSGQHPPKNIKLAVPSESMLEAARCRFESPLPRTKAIADFRVSICSQCGMLTSQRKVKAPIHFSSSASLEDDTPTRSLLDPRRWFAR